MRPETYSWMKFMDVRDRCGCGAETSIGSFFLPGHDKTAESAVISMEYGEVPRFLVRHGYGPGGNNPAREVDKWRSKGVPEVKHHDDSKAETGEHQPDD